jgi:hypothetical protein
MKKCAGFTEKHAIKPTELVGDEALEDRCCILEQTHVAVSQQKNGCCGASHFQEAATYLVGSFVLWK